MGTIPILTVSGTAYEMGYQHGQAYREEIRLLAEERVRLSSDPDWTGCRLPRQEVLALAEACLQEHRAYAPELVQEMEGMAAATGVGLPALLILNGFTDFIDLVYRSGQQERTRAAADDCTAFIVPDGAAADGHGFYGQTWDMHDTATPYVLLLRCRPAQGPEALLFTIMGCLGMIGMNDAGICLGINNLLGGDGQVGVTWPFVVRRALAQSSLEAALACITSAPLAGAHNYLLFDRQGQGYNVEAMSTRQQVTPLDGECLVHTNHCLWSQTQGVERRRTPESQASSEARLARAGTLLAQGPVTPQHLMALTRDREAICVTSTPPYHVQTCGAAIMRPASGDFWAVAGLPTEHEFNHLSLQPRPLAG